jgi:hypothetical protein
MKRMMHPDHGFHNASNVHEEAALRERGWVDDDGLALAAKLRALQLVASPQGQEMGAPSSPGGPAPDGAAPKRKSRPAKAEDDATGLI